MNDPVAPKRPRVNPLALGTGASAIRAIADQAATRAAAGKRVYPFHLGEPDFDTPTAIKQAAIDALLAGEVHYTANAGIPPLRAAIAGDLCERYGADFDASDVVVTVGACEALTLAFLATLEPGAEIVVPTPCWPNYLQTPRLFGVRVREVPMDPHRGYRPDPAAIIAAIGPDTRAIVLNTPNNPTGAIASADTLDALLAAARQHGIWLIVDEIYHDVVFDADLPSVLRLARSTDPLIYVNGFSKSYAMTGWRLGYVAAHGDVTRAMARFHQALVTSATSFAQHGALAALAERDAVASMRATYAVRRDRVLTAFAAAGIDCLPPDGGFYAFARVPKPWPNDRAFCDAMLTDHGVALVPGSAFGAAHGDRFRLCFACADDVLGEGLSVLARAVTDTLAHDPADTPRNEPT